MTDKIKKSYLGQTQRLIEGGGVISGMFAFVGASCCVLPIILVNLGLSSALVANLAFFARAREVFMGFTIALLLAGAIFALGAGRRQSVRFWIMLILALTLLAAAWFMPFYERELLQWVRSR